MDAAGVCDTPLQYWGLSSDKLTIILVHPPIPNILVHTQFLAHPPIPSILVHAQFLVHPPIPSILVQIPTVQKNSNTISFTV